MARRPNTITINIPRAPISGARDKTLADFGYTQEQVPLSERVFMEPPFEKIPLRKEFLQRPLSIEQRRPPTIEEQVAQVLSGPSFPGRQMPKVPQQPMRMAEPVGPMTDMRTMPSMPTTGIASLSDVLPLLDMGGEDIMQLLSDLPKTPPAPVQPPVMPIVEEGETLEDLIIEKHPIIDFPVIDQPRAFIEEERPPMMEEEMVFDDVLRPMPVPGPDGTLGTSFPINLGDVQEPIDIIDPRPIPGADPMPSPEQKESMGMIEQLQQMIADMQAQQQEQAATRAAQEKEITQNYMVPGSRMGYNPYLSGQYQSDPYGPSGVPNMGGITTIPVPDGYGIYNPIYGG